MFCQHLRAGGRARAVARRGPHVAARGRHRGRGAARVRRLQAQAHRAARRHAAQPPRVQPRGQPRQRRGQHAARCCAGQFPTLVCGDPDVRAF